MPPAATICAASCGISVTGLSIRATMVRLQAARSASSSVDQRAQRVRTLGEGAGLARDGLIATPNMVSWLACLVDTGTISARWMVKQGREENMAVRVLLTSNDPVRLSFLTALLADAGVTAVVLDAHASAIEGSIGAIPRRLMVAAEDEQRARRVLAEAGEI